MPKAPRIFSVGFFKARSIDMESCAPFSDVYLVPTESEHGAVQASKESLINFGIPYDDYDICMTFSDWPSETTTHLLSECKKRNIPVIANQHGVFHMISEAATYCPHQIASIWNAHGAYWTDRYEKIFGVPAWANRWVPIGSLKHDLIHRNYQWDPAKTNGKVLLIHEPNHGSVHIDTPSYFYSTPVTEKIIEVLETHNIPYDFKVHPCWSEFIGNTQNQMWRPERTDNLVNLPLHDILEYEAVIGGSSTILLDAITMGMPAINAINQSFPKEYYFDYSPASLQLFPRVEVTDIPSTLESLWGKPAKVDFEKLTYLLGPLGQVANRMQHVAQTLYDQAN